MSEGVFTKYTGEAEDGYDSIGALALLPYVESRHVGHLIRGPYAGKRCQAETAHLSTIVVNMGGMENGWDHKVPNHVAFELSQVTWAFRDLAAEINDPVVKAMLGQ